MGGIDQLMSATGALLGRDRELADMRARFDDALYGRGSLVLLAGEAGIGKTRLADEFTRLAKAAGAAVAWGTGFDDEAVPHYWPWIQALRHCVDELGPEPLSRLGPAEADLAPLLRDGGVPHRLHRDVGEAGEPQQRRFQLFDAVVSLLRGMTRERPLVLVLDDLQWADTPSMLLLEFAASQLHGSRLMLLGCYRSSDALGPHLSGSVAPLVRLGTTIVLTALDESDSVRLLQQTAGGSVNKRMAALVYGRSAGNPFFVQELGRLLVAQGKLADLGTAVALPALPGTVREVIARRLARLSDRCVQTLAAAAVIGTQFDLAVLGTVTRASVAAVADRLEEAVRVNVVLPTADGSRRYRFTHPLLREGLYGDLSPSRRAGFHRRVGEAIEHSHGDTAATLTALARHFYLAATAGCGDKALHYGQRAGRRALAVLAYEEAAEHFTHALEMLDALDQDERQRVELLLALGDARLRAGQGPAAAEAYENAAASARRRKQPQELARAALGLGAGLAGVEVRLLDQGQIDLLREALDALGTEDSSLRSATLGRLSVATSFVEPVARRRAWSREAAAIARRLGDDVALAHALAGYCDAVSALDHVEERFEAATEIVAIAQAGGDKETELLGRRLRVVALLESGDIRAVDAEVDAFERVAEALRQPLYRWYVPLWRGMRAVMEGRLDDCERLLAQARAIGEQGHSRNAQILTFSLGLWWLLESGRPEEACVQLEGFAEERESGFNMPLFRIGMRARAGRRVDAQVLLSAVAAGEFAEVVMDDTAAVAGLCMAAEAAADLGDVGAAATLYDTLLPHASRFAVSGIAAASLGSVSRFLGRLAHLLGRWDTAEEHFSYAMEAHRRAGAALLLAHTLREHAAMASDRGESHAGDAAALLKEANAIYDGLGLTHWVQHRAPLVEAVPSHAIPRWQNTFRREGQLWLLRFAGEEARVADAKGLHDLARLLSTPGKEVHVLDLATAGPGGHPAATRAQDLHEQGHLGPLIDDKARAQYKQRLAELSDDIDHAEALGDGERAQRASIERDALVAHLAAAYGIGGRRRRAGDPTERARSAVTWRIRSALRRIEQAHPALGHHLSHCVKTGTYCSYAPEQAIAWTL